MVERVNMWVAAGPWEDETGQHHPFPPIGHRTLLVEAMGQGRVLRPQTLEFCLSSFLFMPIKIILLKLCTL